MSEHSKDLSQKQQENGSARSVSKPTNNRRRDKPQLSCNNSSSTGISAHERLAYLERLVMSIIPGPAQEANVQPIATTANQTDALVKAPADEQSDCGSMRTDDSELHYQLNGNDAKFTNQLSKGALLLYRCRPASCKEILSRLPPKYAVDRYISQYFNYFDLVSSAAVHGPSFLREYEAFWLDPSSAPITWVGLLFSMKCLACLALEPPSGLEADYQSLWIQSYREKIAQCLTLGQYTKPGPYVLETVIITSMSNSRNVWAIIATRATFPSTTSLQGEMRRRLWATMGMPRKISDGQYDTSEPRNLNDDDIDKDIKELPTSRSETEMTASLGIIARTRMLKAPGIIADLTDAVMPCNYSEVLRVDRILQEAAESIPPPLKVKSMAANLTDSPQAIVARLFVKHMYFKDQIMVHRRFCYMQESRQTDVGYSFSRKACLDECLGSLDIQHVFDEETRPDGQLYTMRWRVISIMNHLFLTATMFLCSLLYPGRTVEREEEIRTTLLRARTIWVRKSSFSKEAQKAAHALSLMVNKLETLQERSLPTGSAKMRPMMPARLL
ncbi:putative transcription factor [Aspergillus stella-maris]|uniref:putative transcription factor n=1 Tax=Aspergillus stella-maris TaxID=1810926 RepID=UPI003CCD3A7A